jgi:alpha/beta superfamily hydrolase
MVASTLREKSVTFEGPGGQLEGRLAESVNKDHGAALLVLHPHPLYGGNMSNNVVKALVRAGQLAGFSTLRINFRGVGRSDGQFANGVGEQDDLQAALAFMDREFGTKAKVLAGYSFGAGVALAYCHRPSHEVDHLYLIAPPPFLLPENLSLEIAVTRKILLGEHDQLAPPDAVKSMVSPEKRESLLEVIPNTDHFFMGEESTLERVFSGFFRTIV